MRLELIHPIFVHFPLALLIIGALLRLACFFLKKNKLRQALFFTSLTLLGIGVVFAWLTVGAGEIAEDIVRPSLCKPENLDLHKHLAYTAAYLFSAGLALDLGMLWKKQWFTPWKVAPLLIALLYATAAAILIFTGGYGASLVYDQGAAVKDVCP